MFFKKHRDFVLTLRKRLKLAKICTNNKFLRKKVGGHINTLTNFNQNVQKNGSIAFYERDFELNFAAINKSRYEVVKIVKNCGTLFIIL